MGKITTIGADRIALKLETKGKAARKNVRRMLDAGAELMVNEARKNIIRYRLLKTGKLHASIGKLREHITDDSASIEIAPIGERTQGKQKPRTERNATIGFVQEHGRSYGKTKREGRPFFADAIASEEPKIIDLWGRMANDD